MMPGRGPNRRGNSGSLKGCARGFTLLELMIVVAILAILATTGVTQYMAALNTARYTKAVQSIKTMQTDIGMYYLQNGKYPSTLDEVGHGHRTDPWGTPFQYLNIEEEKGKGKLRKDKSLVPINTDYDLYSMGPDRRSVPPLTAQWSRDDIVRANDGEYIGPAWKY